MIQWLTFIGLAIIPFAIANGGGRYPKEYLAVGVAAAIGCWGLSRGLFKPIKNNFLFITIFFMLAGTAFVPPSGVALGLRQQNTIVMDDRMDIDNLWNYKPILYAVLFLLMLCALASINIESINDYLLIMAWVGGIMSAIALLQHWGFTQFWAPKPTSDLGWLMKNPEMTSFIGHPTLTAAFVAMCILPALYLRKFELAALMGACIVVTGSAFGLLALIASGLLWIARGRLWAFIGTISFLILAAFVMLFVVKFDNHGRLGVWAQAITDLKRPGQNGLFYAFTGYGAGAYHYANQLMHHSPWAQAHNEFIEFMFNNGVIGLLLLLAAIGVFFKACLQNFYHKEVYILMSIFIVTCILACGTFVWQLGVIEFYTVVILGLAYNRLQQEKTYVA